MGCLPVTSKCCFFIPLRPGLLAWAYLNLVLTVAVFAYTTWFIGVLLEHGPKLQFALIGSLIFGQMLFSLVFIIGLHEKNYKMVYVFYWFSIVEVLISLGLMTWEMIDVFRRPYSHRYHSDPSTFVKIILQIVVNTLLPIYFIILIRSELFAMKGEGEQPATTADDDTRVVLDAPVAKEQDQRYNFEYSSPEFEHKVNTSPLFPVEELRIERLRQQMGQ